MSRLPIQRSQVRKNGVLVGEYTSDGLDFVFPDEGSVIG